MLSDAATVRAAHIVLASSSPRRVDIVNNILKLDANVVPSTFPEDLDKAKYTPTTYVAENAKQKALEVYHRLTDEAGGAPPSLVVGADTVVVRDDTILEKPKSASAAVEMLTSLSGRDHEVCTGVALIYPPLSSGEECLVHTFVERTRVQFAPLPHEVILAYVESGEPMDKAGSYGIQGAGGSFVAGINGCYHSAVGFPMHRFCVELDCDRLREWVQRKSAL